MRAESTLFFLFPPKYEAKTMAPPQIIIVGAGPVGLLTALSLHQGGVPASDILVADKRPTRELLSDWSKALVCGN